MSLAFFFSKGFLNWPVFPKPIVNGGGENSKRVIKLNKYKSQADLDFLIIKISRSSTMHAILMAPLRFI